MTSHHVVVVLVQRGGKYRDSGEDVGPEAIQQVATGRRSRRHTPVPDHLHHRLRPILADLVPDPREYDDLFDRTETFLGLIAADAKTTLDARSRTWIDGPWPGRFLWRQPTPAAVLARETIALDTLGPQWPPLQSGLFGGARERAATAIKLYAKDVTSMKRNMRP
jgi:hypothetical protein